jgi:pilus assembly protein FimV
VSLSKNELLYLLAYADGEVDEDEIGEVEELIAKSDEAKTVLEQQAALRQWVVEAGEKAATRGRAGSIADAVMASIDEQGGPKIIELERERAKRALNQQRIREFGALFAVAAVVALFAFWPSGTPNAPGPVAQNTAPIGASAGVPPAQSIPSAAAPTEPTEPSPESSAAAAVAASEPEVPSIDIDAVESPEHQFSIFYVPGATGANASASSVVVWIGEE